MGVGVRVGVRWRYESAWECVWEFWSGFWLGCGSEFWLGCASEFWLGCESEFWLGYESEFWSGCDSASWLGYDVVFWLGCGVASSSGLDVASWLGSSGVLVGVRVGVLVRGSSRRLGRSVESGWRGWSRGREGTLELEQAVVAIVRHIEISGRIGGDSSSAKTIRAPRSRRGDMLG